MVVAVLIPCRFPGEENFKGTVMHSSVYRNGAPWAGRSALVVGIGNSGAEIALDLHEHKVDTSIVVRSPQIIIPRDALWGYLPFTSFALAFGATCLPLWLRDFVGAMSVLDLSHFGIAKSKQGVASGVEFAHRPPLLDVGTVAAIQAKQIKVVPEISRFRPDGRTVEFVDGRSIEVEVLIKATGYGLPSFHHFLGEEEIKRCCGKNGLPLRSGYALSDDSPLGNGSLYFVGFHDLAGKIREIGLEAIRVAADIRHKISLT